MLNQTENHSLPVITKKITASDVEAMINPEKKQMLLDFVRELVGVPIGIAQEVLKELFPPADDPQVIDGLLELASNL